jgi:tetratricopeptide (TPR) repeat protein/transglutaminase-like putative cysteine protease
MGYDDSNFKLSRLQANMRIRRFGVWFSLIAGLLFGVVPLSGQNSRPATSGSSDKQTQPKSSGAAAAKAPDYSNEPIIYEKVLTNVVFEKDGTSTSDTRAVAKVQTQAGVQESSILSLPYASADSTLDVLSVRVRKADGTVVDTPVDSAQDMPAEITREAPYYSDLREKQVAVKGLEPGCTVEYEYRVRQKPLTPGEFWYSYNFTKNIITLSEELKLSVPSDRQVIVGSGSLKPVVTVESGERIYTWKTSHLRHETGDATERARESLDAPPADVLVTSFRNWADVGAWYRGLAGPRAAPTAAIRAKEQELTKGMTTDAEKVRAIYNYVSLQFRYVGVAFGIGRYQPHTAEEVLNNDYGDCKDKETLLAALLAAAGVKAYPALINSLHKIDPGVPSPGEFDHVIAAVPQGTGYLWLDTTPGVAPAGYLLANLRGKEALVMPDDGPARLVKTPANPPFPLSESFTADAKLDTAGTLDSDMKTNVDDDSEVLLRLAFRATSEDRWKNLVQAISYRMGFGGTVSKVVLSPVDTTDSSLEISYHYARKDYSSWSDGKITLPLPPFFFPAAKDGTKADAAKKPVRLGSPAEDDYTASVTLPAGYTPVLPAAANLVEDFAEYHSRYSFANGVLRGERRLVIKENKVPAAEMGEYEKFVQAVKDDATAMISLRVKSASAASGASAVPQQAESFYEQGRKAMGQRDLADAANFFEKAVAADGKFAMAWAGLGAAHLEQGDVDQGIEELRKAIAADPKQAFSYRVLARAQIMLRRPDDALETWRSLEKADPDDGDAPLGAGSILLMEKRYAEAVPELEKAVKHNSTNGLLFLGLGQAELKTNQPAKAFDALKQGLQLDPSALNENDAAYDLADANLHLHAALGYAEKAVEGVEQETANVSLDSLSYTDLLNVTELADFWDTLGWVDFRLGNDAEAEKYLRAAWQLSQDPEIAKHLGEVYDKEGKTQEAEKYYAFALAAPGTTAASAPGLGGAAPTPELSADAMPKTRARLRALLKSGAREFDAEQRARRELIQLRTVNLPKMTTSTEMAEFFVLIAPGPKVAAVKFLSGSETLRTAVKDLSSARFNVTFPDAGPEKILRRGVLDCERVVHSCQFILMTPDSVHSIQ